jgi:uncharacterized membrane protein
MRRPSAIVTLVLAALLWIVALGAAPVAASSADSLGTIASAMVYTAGSLVCHQRPERSFHVDRAQFPVCARCLGLYAGGVLGVFFWAGIAGVGTRAAPRAVKAISSTHVRLVLLVIALPTVASVAAAALGWWDGSNVVRATLALPLGAAIGAVVTAVAAGDLR